MGHAVYPCLLGRKGRRHGKREGDGASPVGIWQLDRAFYRADRIARPFTLLKLRSSLANDAWCEDPASFAYNRQVKRPFGAGHETFWRDDEAYDIVISTSHNTRPRVRGFGSAIFFHLTRRGCAVTAGCIAVSLSDMRKILPRCGPGTRLVIWPPDGSPPRALQGPRRRSFR